MPQEPSRFTIYVHLKTKTSTSSTQAASAGIAQFAIHEANGSSVRSGVPCMAQGCNLDNIDKHRPMLVYGECSHAFSTRAGMTRKPVVMSFLIRSLTAYGANAG